MVTGIKTYRCTCLCLGSSIAQDVSLPSLLTEHPSHVALTEDRTLIPSPITSFVSNGRGGMNVGERDSWGIMMPVDAHVQAED